MMAWGNEGETFFSKEVAIEALFFFPFGAALALQACPSSFTPIFLVITSFKTKSPCTKISFKVAYRHTWLPTVALTNIIQV